MSKTTVKLINELDRVFSIFIRKRDADDDGVVRCVTCNFVAHWSRLTCGHFRKRRHMATRWNEHNALPQCSECNGKDVDIEHLLKQRFGDHVIERIIYSSNQEKKYTQQELKTFIERYSKQL